MRGLGLPPPHWRLTQRLHARLRGEGPPRRARLICGALSRESLSPGRGPGPVSLDVGAPNDPHRSTRARPGRGFVRKTRIIGGNRTKPSGVHPPGGTLRGRALRGRTLRGRARGTERPARVHPGAPREGFRSKNSNNRRKSNETLRGPPFAAGAPAGAHPSRAHPPRVPARAHPPREADRRPRRHLRRALLAPRARRLLPTLHGLTHARNAWTSWGRGILDTWTMCSAGESIILTADDVIPGLEGGET
jgi:hypothetical protein